MRRWLGVPVCSKHSDNTFVRCWQKIRFTTKPKKYGSAAASVNARPGGRAAGRVMSDFSGNWKVTHSVCNPISVCQTPLSFESVVWVYRECSGSISVSQTGSGNSWPWFGFYSRRGFRDKKRWTLGLRYLSGSWYLWLPADPPVQITVFAAARLPLHALLFVILFNLWTSFESSFFLFLVSRTLGLWRRALSWTTVFLHPNTNLLPFQDVFSREWI